MGQQRDLVMQMPSDESCVKGWESGQKIARSVKNEVRAKDKGNNLLGCIFAEKYESPPG